jgi:branched-chain amino acid transport system ATP-binding protein/branched-chain amino acid transport system permease protein
MIIARRSLISLAIVSVVLFLLVPFIAGPVSGNTAFNTSVLSQAVITAIMVISLNLVMGVTGLLSLVQTGLLAVGAYALGYFSIHLGINPLYVIPISMVISALLAWVMVLVSGRAQELYFGLITLAFSLAIITVAQQWTPVTGGFIGLNNLPKATWQGVPISKLGFYTILVVLLLLVYVVQRNTILSPTGRAMQAVRISPATAQSLAIKPHRIRVFAFVLGGAIAGLGGALYAMNLGSISPGAGALSSSLVLFIALFLGGLGSIYGPILGVMFLTLAQVVIRGQGPYQDLILGVLLLICMFTIPLGVVGAWNKSRFAVPPKLPTADHDRALRVTPPVIDNWAFRVHHTEESLLAGRNLSRSFGGVDAVRNVSIELHPGQIHGVIGPNGAGKSTLVNCLTGFDCPSSGSVLLRGVAMPPDATAFAAGGVARVFQIPHVLEDLAVIDNVLVGLDARQKSSWIAGVLRLPNYRRSERAKRQEALRLLTDFGIAKLAAQPANSCSHGQKRLLEIVRAVASEPDILILDEPATGLTGNELANLKNLIATLRERGVAVLLIEHNVDFVFSLSDQITVLHLGEVLISDSPTAVRSSKAVQEAYLVGSVSGDE